MITFSTFVGIILSIVMGIGTAMSYSLAGERSPITIICAIVFVGLLGIVAYKSRNNLKGRTAAFGFNSFITVLLVTAIVGVLNFLASRYSKTWDLTKNKKHTLSDQTSKVIKGLKTPVKAVFFTGPGGQERFKVLFGNLKELNPKFEVEYVDPNREPTRTKAAGIKRIDTLQLIVPTSEGAVGKEQKIEDVSEEKITNALIKMLKPKAQTLCAVNGHGERSFSSSEGDGLADAKKLLADQSYDVHEMQLATEAKDGKIPDTCDALMLMGPSRDFFPAEVKLISDYLNNGGRAFIGLDVTPKNLAAGAELFSTLESWNIKPVKCLVVDPISRVFGADPTIPIVVTYSKDSPITREASDSTYFPFSRALEAIPNPPEGIQVQWLAQSTDKAWAEMDAKQLASGKVQLDEGIDKKGPLNLMMSVEGKRKDSKASRKTRIVVAGSAHFASNQFIKHGQNSDVFLNSIAWLMEEENLISIHTKDEDQGRIELSLSAATIIFWLCVVILPLVIAIAGVSVWVIRRRL